MPFGINDKVVVAPFGVKDKVEEEAIPLGISDVASEEEVLPTPTQDITKPVKPTAPAIDRGGFKPLPEEEPVDLMGLGITTVASQAEGQTATKEQEEEKISFKELAQDNDYFKIITDYMEARHQKPFKKGMDREEYVKDYMDEMRFQDFNIVAGGGVELGWLLNATKEDALKGALAADLYNNTASTWEKGGQGGLRPYYDAIFGVVTDPTILVGFGAGKLAAKGATSTGLKLARNKAMQAIGATAAGTARGIKVGAGVVAEGAVGVATNVTEQKKDRQVDKLLGKEVKDISYSEAAVIGVLAGVLGGGSVYLDTRKAAKEAGSFLKDKQAELVKSGKVKMPVPGQKTQKVTDAAAEKLAEQAGIKEEGKRVLQSLGKGTSLSAEQISKDMSARAVRVAMSIAENQPELILKGDTSSDTVYKIFQQLDQVDDAVLEQAIIAEGLTPKQFAAANKMTVSEAGSVLQAYSTASKLFSRLRSISPAFDKEMEEIYGKMDTEKGWFGKSWQFMQKVDKTGKAFITSGIDTSIRNIAGSGIGIPLKAAANLVEGTYNTSVFALTKAGKAAMGKDVSDMSITAMAGDSIKDALGTMYYLKNNGLAADITDKLLSSNPALRNNLLGAMQEGSRDDVFKIAQHVSVLNAAQDAFFRRAVFAASVQKQLRAQGIDMMQVLADDKLVPSAILSRAADDSLKMTLSYAPKAKPLTSFENIAETGAKKLIDAVEFVPVVGSTIATFPRFMANAIAFQYKYSMLGGVSGGADILKGLASKNISEGRKVQLIRDGKEKISQGVVGTAALAWAYQYRTENQDINAGEMKTNRGTIDVRAVFPLAPALYIADFLFKAKNNEAIDAGPLTESVLGMKLSSGSQNQLFQQMAEMASSEKSTEKVTEGIFKILGDYGARFVQPFVVKNVYDLMDLFREEGTVVRDPNILDDDASPLERGMQAAGQRIQSKIPVLKEGLEEAVIKGKEGTLYRENQFFNRLIGLSQKPTKTPTEREFDRVAINPYKLYGSGSGDKVFDKKVVEMANPMVIDRVEELMGNPDYNNLPVTEARYQLTKAVGEEMRLARENVKEDMEGVDKARIDKMTFNRLTADERRIINQRYANDNEGVTLEEANDYSALEDYIEDVKDLGLFASGGLVSQTNKLLSR